MGTTRWGARFNFRRTEAAHPDFIAARDSYVARTLAMHRLSTNQTNTLRTNARRLVFHIATFCPGLAPNDYNEGHAQAYRSWARETYGREQGAGRHGGSAGVFEECVRLGSRDADKPNPFTPQPIARVEPPAGIPERLRRERAALVAHCQEQLAQNIRSEGAEGWGEGYTRNVLRTFDGLLQFMIAHSADPDAARIWPLTLEAIFGDVEIVGTFLLAAPPFKPHLDALSKSARDARKTDLRAAYRFFTWKRLLRAPTFFAELDEHIAQGRPSADLGGEPEQVFEGLDRDEIAAVRALVVRRAVIAESLLAKARDQRQRHHAERRVGDNKRGGALFEFLLGTGGRVQSAASLDGRKFRRNERGSIIADALRWKSRGTVHWRSGWVPALAYDTLADYCEWTGRVAPLAGPDAAQHAADPQQPWGPQVVVHKGQKYADTVMPERRVFYPVFRANHGGPLTPQQISNIITRLLQAAGCRVTRPHVLRHTACDIAINVWGVSPSDAARVFGWKTVTLVLNRYGRGQLDRIYERFDAFADRDLSLPGAAVGVVRITAKALADLCHEIAQEDREGALTALWNSLFLAQDQLSDLDPSRPRVSEMIYLSQREWHQLAEWIRERSDRHTDAEGLLGRSVVPGLSVPNARPPRPQASVTALSGDPR